MPGVPSRTVLRFKHLVCGYDSPDREKAGWGVGGRETEEEEGGMHETRRMRLSSVSFSNSENAQFVRYEFRHSGIPASDIHRPSAS